MKSKAITTMIFFLAGIFILALYVVPVAATPDDSIVGLWHLDKKFGTALSFDGIDDYVEVDSASIIMPGELTVEAWIKPDKTGARQSLVSKWDGYGDASYSLELTSINKFLFYLHDGAITKSITGTTVITVGTWYHVAGTYDGTHARLYVNGVLEAGPTSLVAPMTNSSVPLRIGASSRYAPYPLYCQFRGVIDEVRISNVAYDTFDLSGPLTADGNTVALWRFDDTPGTTASDSSGNENHGTLHNFASPYGWVDTTLAPDTSSNNNFGTIYGATWTTGMFDCALSFYGDDYVEVAHSTSLDVSPNYTFEAWVYLTDDSDYRGLFRRGTRGVSASEIEIYIHPGWAARKLVVVHNRGGAFCYRYFTMFPLNQWIYLAVTWDGTTVRAYYNAIEQTIIGGTGTVMVNPAVSDKPSFIGLGYYAAYTHGNTPYMIGLIDEVRISNVVRTPVYIDIKPGSDPNSICLSKQGLLPVAILSTDNFDAIQIDPSSLELGGAQVSLRGSKKAPKTAYSIKDVDGDGDLDMMAFFSVPDLVTEGGLTLTTASLELTGTLTDGTPIVGIDSVRIVPE